MRLLLDTRSLIWVLADPSRVGVRALQAVRDPANELFVSAITPFEIATKHRLGKLEEADGLLLAYDDFLARLGAKELAMSSHHGLVAGQLRSPHRDPFDRILAAQAITESMVLVTSDPAFDSIGGVRALWS